MRSFWKFNLDGSSKEIDSRENFSFKILPTDARKLQVMLASGSTAEIALKEVCFTPVAPMSASWRSSCRSSWPDLKPLGSF